MLVNVLSVLYLFVKNYIQINMCITIKGVLKRYIYPEITLKYAYKKV